MTDVDTSTPTAARMLRSHPHQHSNHRRPISFNMHREYNTRKSKGKLAEIIDFHLHGKNRYLKINQPVRAQQSDENNKKEISDISFSTASSYSKAKLVESHTSNTSNISPTIESSKRAYLIEKNIQLNMSTKDVEDLDSLAKKPLKSRATIARSKATQTPRGNIATGCVNSADSKKYVHELIDNAQALGRIQKANKINGQSSQVTNVPNVKSRNSKKTTPTDKLDTKKKPSKKPANSLGLAMETKHGIHMAVIGSHSGPNNDQLLVENNYSNLERLIDELGKNELRVERNAGENYARVAKLNRLKVLIELSMKIVGRKYKGNKKSNTNSILYYVLN
jgi:hypothetical protein